MKDRSAKNYGLLAFVLLVTGLSFAVKVETSPVLAGADGGRPAALSPAGQAPQYTTKLAGAYFFYWWLFDETNGRDVDHPTEHPNNFMPFHPPGLMESFPDPQCFYGSEPGFHLPEDGHPEWCIPFDLGSYNAGYYRVDNQRWWEWQFRDMAEAGLDIAFLNSWDVVSLHDPSNPLSGFLRDDKTIFRVRDYLVPALGAIGDPIKIALFDDTAAEHHQWCFDHYSEPQLSECLTPPWEDEYKMPLDETTGGLSNREYFWRKVVMFYGEIPSEKWATHTGLPAGPGGRPVILMWQARDFFKNMTSINPVTGQTYAVTLMCEIKQDFYETYGVEPLLLPNHDWYLQDDSVAYNTICAWPFEPFHVVDGYSEFGVAAGLSDPYELIHDVAGYATAYIGPGRDDQGYSGPFGQVQVPGGEYNARWWGKFRERVITTDQARFYDLNWNDVETWEQDFSPKVVNLVVIESWNEVAEGSTIAQIDDYIGPDLDVCPGPYYEDCEATITFNKNPGEDPGQDPERTPHYWIEKTRQRVEDWKAEAPDTLIVDNNNDCSVGQDGVFSRSSGWTCSVFDQNYCDDACYGSRDAGQWARWEPWLILGDGIYDVYAWWQNDDQGTQDAHFGIYGGASSLVRIDQSRRRDAGRWNYLGRFPFASGSGVELTSLVEHPAGTRVLADAIRFVYGEPYTPPPGPVYLPLVFKIFVGSGPGCFQKIHNGDFEAGEWVAWEESSSGGRWLVGKWGNAHSGYWSAYLAGYDNADDLLWQDNIDVPLYVTSAYLRFWRYITTDEGGGAGRDDLVAVELQDQLSGEIIPLYSLSNRDAHPDWVKEDIAIDINDLNGRELIRLRFHATTDPDLATHFYLDDVELIICGSGVRGGGPVPPTPTPERGYPTPPGVIPILPTPTPLRGYPPDPTPAPMPGAPGPVPTKPSTPNPVSGLNSALTARQVRESPRYVAAAYKVCSSTWLPTVRTARPPGKIPASTVDRCLPRTIPLLAWQGKKQEQGRIYLQTVT